MSDKQIDKQIVEPIVEPIVKRKKGRPRKEVTDTPLVEKQVEEKKKRGRKRKEGIQEVKQKKKRGRKAAVKYFSSSIRKKIPLTTVLQDNNNYILHLDIQESKNEIETGENEIETGENEIETFGNEIETGENEIETFGNEIETGENEIGKINEILNKIGNIKLDKNEIINAVFEELRQNNSENEVELRKEYKDLIEKDDFDVNKLYEHRIEFREKQDNILVHKLEIQSKNKLNNKKENKVDVNNQEYNRKRGFFKVLGEFIENEEWLHSTSVCCWWCCHTFDTVPIGMPCYYNNSIHKFRVKGVFCNFSCMIAYKDDQKINNINHNINFLYSKMTGTISPNCVLKSAPSRYTLKMFGGQLTIDEFRYNFTENKIYKMVEYPMFISNDYMEEIDIKNIKRANHKLFDENNSEQSRVFNNLDDKRVEDAKSRLLIIENATVTVGNTIDKFIKFS
jgi:hypothetical protein